MSQNKKPLLMAILNLTPDSFSDGGLFNDKDAALARCEQLLKQGADLIDLGGESTRPGAKEISQQEEMDRVLPVLEAIKENLNCPVSVDTSSEGLMRESLAFGVKIINDVRALRTVSDPGFLADTECQICLMHMKGEPKTMQAQASYKDVVDEVKTFLSARIEYCVNNGISKDRLIVDPGFGFGKTLINNLTLLNRLQVFEELNCPILVGISRKSMIGKVLDKEVEQRLYGSLAALTVAVQNGASIVRVHDVGESRDVLDMTWAIMKEGHFEEVVDG